MGAGKGENWGDARVVSLNQCSLFVPCFCLSDIGSTHLVFHQFSILYKLNGNTVYDRQPRGIGSGRLNLQYRCQRFVDSGAIFVYRITQGAADCNAV